MKLPHHTLSLALALALPGVAAAQGPATELDEVSVTATRTAIAVEDSLVPVQVIDRGQIDRSQAGSLLELLRGRAGLDFTNQGGPGKLSSLFLRGTASNQVLVLVDGVRIGAATTGMPALQDLPIDQIDRVEIVRGPRSSLYGSEAIGGVIQIFTRSAGTGLQQNLALTAGSHNLRQASAGFSNRGERGWLSVQGGYQATDGINACNGSSILFQGCYVEEPDRDGYRNTSINLRGGHALGDTLTLEGHALNSDSFNEFDGSIFSGNQAKNRQQVLGAKLDWTPGERLRVTTQVARSQDQADGYYADGGSRDKVSVFDTRRDTASLQGDFTLAEGQLLSAGADWQRDEVTSDTVFAIDHRDNLGGFVEYQGSFGAHSLQLSVRNDDNEQFGNHATGSLGYGLALGNGLRFTASAGTGFKAPTFNDLYFPWSSNPALKPERSKSLNLGLAQYADSWNWTFNAYETRIDQLIALDNTYTPYNTAEARIRGAELTGFLSLAGFDLNAQASFTDPRDHTAGTASYGNWLARRARTHGRLDVDRNFGPLRVGMSAFGSGHRFDNAANSVRLAGYGTLDLRVEYALNEAWKLQAKAANVFDRGYETIAWYNQPGREYQLSVRYRGSAL
ncbi:TonB-dependent vitamin B12 receptor [Stenotrophomonas sp. YIM B06876]|uniref:TonB-dependent vitamin B12 receptor n=1 Tax=Stenotrophomonas sp. YIM B06876 TaxID=3060211 RepID=UPI0027390AE9|nr:TonB-dependent vitamin B12 receptor [Stenotrophomonas sp. YIM B06876]